MNESHIQSTWIQAKISQLLKETNSVDTLILDVQPLDLRETHLCCVSPGPVVLRCGSSSTLIRELTALLSGGGTENPREQWLV